MLIQFTPALKKVITTNLFIFYIEHQLRQRILTVKTRDIFLYVKLFAMMFVYGITSCKFYWLFSVVATCVNNNCTDDEIPS